MALTIRTVMSPVVLNWVMSPIVLHWVMSPIALNWVMSPIVFHWVTSPIALNWVMSPMILHWVMSPIVRTSNDQSFYWKWTVFSVGNKLNFYMKCGCTSVFKRLTVIILMSHIERGERERGERKQMQLPTGSIWNCNTRTLYSTILEGVKFLLGRWGHYYQPLKI